MHNYTIKYFVYLELLVTVSDIVFGAPFLHFLCLHSLVDVLEIQIMFNFIYLVDLFLHLSCRPSITTFKAYTKGRLKSA